MNSRTKAMEDWLTNVIAEVTSRNDWKIESYAMGVPKADEVMTTSATGGKKGVKLCEMSALPSTIAHVGLVAGYGTRKYGRLNYMKGYEWSKNYDAMQRHLMAFWGGEYLDPESGLPHLAHASWHCMVLMEFYEKGLGVDDRTPYGSEGKGSVRTSDGTVEAVPGSGKL